MLINFVITIFFAFFCRVIFRLTVLIYFLYIFCRCGPFIIILLNVYSVHKSCIVILSQAEMICVCMFNIHGRKIEREKEEEEKRSKTWDFFFIYVWHFLATLAFF